MRSQDIVKNIMADVTIKLRVNHSLNLIIFFVFFFQGDCSTAWSSGNYPDESGHCIVQHLSKTPATTRWRVVGDYGVFCLWRMVRGRNLSSFSSPENSSSTDNNGNSRSIIWFGFNMEHNLQMALFNEENGFLKKFSFYNFQLISILDQSICRKIFFQNADNFAVSPPVLSDRERRL